MSDQVVKNKFEDGADCHHSGCNGKLTPCDIRGCSCHIHPPCSACVGNPYECDTCGDVFELPPPPLSKWTPKTSYVAPKRRTLEDLDRSKIDWIIAGGEGWHSGMVVHGFCPLGTTQDDILIALGIKSRPCLPSFKSFEGGGYFKVSYFTD